MKGRRLLALPVLAFVLSCGDDPPTGPRAPTSSSQAILDGAHAGNRDFFFLPPLVPLAQPSDGFELGEFNNTLKPRLKIEICRLVNLPAGVLPIEATACDLHIRTFGPESVNLVNLPRRQWGWWSLFGLPPDGFYYVLWNTRQPGLSASRYYRVTVLIDGSIDGVPGVDERLGFFDLDPMANLREWRHAKTQQVVQLVNGSLLPIPFRVENRALSACAGSTQCASAILTNDNPNGESQVLQVENEDGVPIAGVQVFDGWLGEDGPDNVVFTITRVNTGINDLEAGTQTDRCHARLDLQQFEACFNYSTIPDLGGRQFAARVVAAVCFVLHDHDPPDPRGREDWVQLWSSEPDDPEDTPKPLVGADAGAILVARNGKQAENCETQDVPVGDVGDNSSNALTRFASAGWQKLKGGVGRVFGVKTAYAIDAGLGGILDDLSNIGPALTAEMRSNGPTATPGVAGTPMTSSARIVGTRDHDDVDPLCDGDDVGCKNPEGIPGLPVTFTLRSSSGAQIPFSVGGPTSIVVNSISDGVASLLWTPPAPGVYTLEAEGQVTGGPVTFTTTVTAPPIVGLNNLSDSWVNENEETNSITALNFGVDGSALSVRAWGACSPWSCVYPSTTGSTTAWTGSQQITAIWDHGFAIETHTITYLSASRLQVVEFVDFQAPDPRTDYTVTEYFERPGVNHLAGSWVNEAGESPDVTTLSIQFDGSSAFLQASGRCVTDYCDWGSTDGNTSGWSSNQQITASWDQGFAIKTLTITFLAPDRIKVVTFVNFSEGDPRTDYYSTEYFKINT